MTTSTNVKDNLNDKNTKTHSSKDPNKKKLMKKFKKMKERAKKKKKYNNYLSMLEPNKKITAKDLLIRTGQIKEGRRYKYKDLKDNKIPLTPEERKEVMSRKAVWHFAGSPTSAIWKAKDKDGNIVYGTNTHRAMSVKPTLKGAINAYHNFIKGTA